MAEDTNRAYVEWLAARFKLVDWLVPAYLTMGFLSRFAAEIERTPEGDRLDLVRATLREVYNADYLAVMLAERYPRVPYVQDFTAPIEEAIRAYFSGYRFVSVAGLIPVVEGIIRKIATSQGRDVGLGTRKLVREFDAFLERETNSPNCYGERLAMLEVLRNFIRDRYLTHTDQFDGLNDFNRHGIVHGLFEGYGDDLNFFRLITLLDLLCFSIGLFHDGISMFAPAPTTTSIALAVDLLSLRPA